MLVMRARDARAMIPGMAAADDAVMRALSGAWARIREDDDGVPDAVFDLQPGRSSGCSTVGWESAPVLVLNLMEGERKLTGAEILRYLLHQASHAAAGVATSSEGRFHPQAFREAGERLGLDVDRGPAGTGWSKISLARGTLTRYQPQVRALDRAVKAFEPVLVRKHNRGAVAMVCACRPKPRVLWVSSGAARQGGIICTFCGQPFTLRDSPMVPR